MKVITMPRLAMIAVASASLGLAACNNPKDDATEKAADAVEASSEAAADSLESRAAMTTGAASEALEDKADAVKKSGEAKADALEDAADEAKKN
ncbi:hypothetical protein [Novosphingobium sp. Leaf2]|uniref:hypothetical protein n=1 Tax=Novosphingobium sp. Leaf2 TaxID=1735670 RepID=UPI0006FE06FB|nr:hypothetical protein [Novosphingobium sp. Leaf2]KQM18901.1 hypothetical protein ASE49_07175 [Novosphingobium sp. Leaf2]